MTCVTATKSESARLNALDAANKMTGLFERSRNTLGRCEDGCSAMQCYLDAA